MGDEWGDGMKRGKQRRWKAQALCNTALLSSMKRFSHWQVSNGFAKDIAPGIDAHKRKPKRGLNSNRNHQLLLFFHCTGILLATYLSLRK